MAFLARHNMRPRPATANNEHASVPVKFEHWTVKRKMCRNPALCLSLGTPPSKKYNQHSVIILKSKELCNSSRNRLRTGSRKHNKTSTAQSHAHRFHIFQDVAFICEKYPEQVIRVMVSYSFFPLRGDSLSYRDAMLGMWWWAHYNSTSPFPLANNSRGKWFQSCTISNVRP